jgi:hypothetical protein
MYQQTTLAAVAPLAQTLTESGMVLAVKEPSFPLATMAGLYANPVEGDQRPLTEQVMQVAQEDFEEANAEPTPEDGDVVDRLSGLMANGLNAILHNSRNVIRPAVLAYCAAFDERQRDVVKPKIEISVFNYDPVHDEPRLVNHLQSRYTTVQQRPSYRSFILPQASAEQVIEMVANNNPHLDPPQVTEWLLKVGAETIASVWQQLFSVRALDALSLSMLQRHRLPFSVDELLLAYCLVGHMAQNPADVTGESVELEEWANAMMHLHELFGAALLGAYGRRVAQLQRNVLVLRSDGNDPIGRRTVEVVANGDLYGAWIEQGNDVQVLLGGAILNPSVTRVEDFAQHADVFLKKWLQVYPLICQAQADDAVRNRRKTLLNVMSSPNKDVASILPQIQINELMQSLRNSLQQCPDAMFDNIYAVVTKLVCEAYFPNPIYQEFLMEMDKASKIHGGDDNRALAAVALVAIGGDWLAAQIQAVPFVPFINPALGNAVDNGQSQSVPVEGEGVISNETQELEDTAALAAAQAAETGEAEAGSEQTEVTVENADAVQALDNVESGLGAPADGEVAQAAEPVEVPSEEDKGDDIKMKILRSRIGK